MGKDMTLIAEGLQFPEGPIWLKDGRVLVVEIKTGTLAAVSMDGTVERVATTGGGPNGAAVGPDGKVYVCNNGGFEWYELEGIVAPGPQPADYIGGRIQRVDIDSGQVEDVYTECAGNPLRGPNDIVFDDQGGFYFTDLGKSRARDQDKAGVYYAHDRRLVDHRDRVRPRPRQRDRPVARRLARVRGRDDHRPGVGVGHRVAGRVQAAHRRSPPATCCTASTATSCSTRWPSTATATSASPRSSPGASA